MKFLLKLILFIGGIIGLSLFSVWAMKSSANIIIFEMVVGMVMIGCLIFIVKIIRDPALTSYEKWNKLLGR